MYAHPCGSSIGARASSSPGALSPVRHGRSSRLRPGGAVREWCRGPYASASGAEAHQIGRPRLDRGPTRCFRCGRNSIVPAHQPCGDRHSPTHEQRGRPGRAPGAERSIQHRSTATFGVTWVTALLLVPVLWTGGSIVEADYFAFSTISRRRQRLVADSGRVSMTRTRSPVPASLFSSWALRRMVRRMTLP